MKGESNEKKDRFRVKSRLASIFIASTAYSWNYATHAFIAGKIGKNLPVHNFNEMYGLMAPDILNFEFSLMNDSVLRGYTHGIPADAAAYYPFPSPMRTS